VSVLRPGDEVLHYSDSSHRWIAPPDMEQSLWDAGMRAHQALHLATMGGSVAPKRSRNGCRPPRVPAERMPDMRQGPTARLARMGALRR
jgi:hypothetical protein